MSRCPLSQRLNIVARASSYFLGVLHVKISLAMASICFTYSYILLCVSMEKFCQRTTKCSAAPSSQLDLHNLPICQSAAARKNGGGKKGEGKKGRKKGRGKKGRKKWKITTQNILKYIDVNNGFFKHFYLFILFFNFLFNSLRWDNNWSKNNKT